jgi:two-component system, sporulation sensor kinase E
LLVGLRIEENDENVNIEHIDKLQDLITAEIGDRDIEVIWNNRADKGLNIPGKLEQIVFNLLKNALEILPDSGRIIFNMYQKREFLVIEVSDSGPGIPSNIRNQLFDPFFTTKPNGTGLGLWVVYRLVQSMQGIIEIESAKGQGSTFHVSVPVIRAKVA